MAKSAIHSVVEGDTLKDIAYQYGSSVPELIIMNNWEHPPMLYVGMEINVPARRVIKNPFDEVPAKQERGHITRSGVKVRYLRDCQQILFEGRWDDDHNRHAALEEMMNWLWSQREDICIDCITYDNEESGEETYHVVYERHAP